MKKPHKHAEVIKAWADGAKIQYRNLLTSHAWTDKDEPNWITQDHVEYRIKPEPKPDIVLYGKCVLIRGYGEVLCKFDELEWDDDNLQATFDGETGKLKAVKLI